MSEIKNKIESFFNGLHSNSMHLVDEFYHPECQFEDPLGSIKGVAGIKRYYQNLYRNVIEIRFEFKTIGIDGRRAYAPWTMHLRAKAIRGGQLVSVPGLSEFEFDKTGEKVIYHRDYFDMGAFIYEHVPILSSAIRFIRQRLKHE